MGQASIAYLLREAFQLGEGRGHGCRAVEPPETIDDAARIVLPQRVIPLPEAREHALLGDPLPLPGDGGSQRGELLVDGRDPAALAHGLPPHACAHTMTAAYNRRRGAATLRPPETDLARGSLQRWGCSCARSEEQGTMIRPTSDPRRSASSERRLAACALLSLLFVTPLACRSREAPAAAPPIDVIRLAPGAERMVLLTGGEVRIGKDGFADFSPAHTVHLDPFYIDRCEVTNADYAAFCEATGHRLPEFWTMDVYRSGPDYSEHPVVGVSWRDAQAYARWRGCRLPTEAE
ncbi:MAG: SUMF1/EgtB/PvdO family nonheme iron enzyme [Candidatus Eisenbacteria bacterium]|nr:SUMF1/EgtB/PvdO family nonheme iron enzyme [Candidatus Eisenbacteria bacterium]